MGAQVIGNSKTSPGSVYDYFDLMFSKQDEIHDYANTGRHFVTSSQSNTVPKANDTQLVDYVADEILKKSQVFSSFAADFKKVPPSSLRIRK